MATSARPRARTRPRFSSHAASEPPLADAMTVNPYLGPRLGRPVPRRLPPRTAAGIFFLVRTSNAGRAATSRTPSSSDGAPVWHHVAGARRRVGRRSRRRARAVERRRGRRRDVPRAIGEARRAMPQAIILLPGRRRAGRDPGRRRARVHERAGERARQCVAVGDLRLPRRARTTGGRPRRARRRGCPPRSGRRRAGDARPARGRRGARVAAPIAFLLVVTVALLLVRSGLRDDAPAGITTSPSSRPTRRPRST